MSMSMFPHTVTLYIVEVSTDPVTYESVVRNHITFLRGVLLDSLKSVNVRKSSQDEEDKVNLYIPFDVQAVDGITGNSKKYVPPVEFWKSENKEDLWTLAIGAKGTSGTGTHGNTFFVKGETLPPDGVKPEDVMQVMDSSFDHAYNITKVNEMDFGSLKHWEVRGA